MIEFVNEYSKVITLIFAVLVPILIVVLNRYIKFIDEYEYIKTELLKSNNTGDNYITNLIYESRLTTRMKDKLFNYIHTKCHNDVKTYLSYAFIGTECTTKQEQSNYMNNNLPGSFRLFFIPIIKVI